MQVQDRPKLHSPDEYHKLEETAEERSEYRNGEMISMAGGTANHNRIAGAFYRAFPPVINEQEYECFIGDMRLWIPDRQIATYPDLMVIEGEPIYSPGRQDVVENPCVLVEVLSKSTQLYDQNEKFEAYRTIPSLREYVMIDQYRYGVKQFVRSDRDRWIFSESVGESAVLQLETLDFAIGFADLYRRVKFDAEPI